MLTAPEEAYFRPLSVHSVADKVQQVAAQGTATQTQVQDIIERSRQLSSLAETVKSKLGEQLATIQKGRRSQQAYQSVKYQE